MSSRLQDTGARYSEIFPRFPHPSTTLPNMCVVKCGLIIVFKIHVSFQVSLIFIHKFYICLTIAVSVKFVFDTYASMMALSFLSWVILFRL